MPKSPVDDTPEPDARTSGRAKLERIKHQPLPTTLPPRQRVKVKKQGWKSPLPVGYGVIGATVLVVAVVIIAVWSAEGRSSSKVGTVADLSVKESFSAPSGELAQAAPPVEVTTTPAPVAQEKSAVGASQGRASIGRRPKEKASETAFDGGPKTGVSLEEYFRKLDANGDNRLDSTEVPRHIITRADTNHDDQLTLNELQQAFKKRGQRLFGPSESTETAPPASGRVGSGHPPAQSGL